MKVEGIGTVELQTKRSRNRSGRDNHGVLHLTNVLHVPSSFCNILGGLLLEEYNLGVLGRDPIKDRQGQSVAFLYHNPCRLLQVKLRGPPVGPTVFKEGMHCCISVRWPDSERQKWVNFQAASGTHISQGGYTQEEKAWLKEAYGNEYHFLHSMGLKIFKEEDREEGRTILRALMSGNGNGKEKHGNKEDSKIPSKRKFHFQIEELDHDSDEEMNEQDSDEEMNEQDNASDSVEEHGESDLEGHMADYLFSHNELEWIEKAYGNSMNFMFSFGLKFYDPEDCDAATELVKEFMA